MTAKKIWGAPTRNAQPILEVLRRVLPTEGNILEIASGSGQHAAHFTEAQPLWRWQPSDLDAENRASIAAYQAEAQQVETGSNFLPPISLDVCADWPPGPFDAVVCFNMIHIAPWAATTGLFAGAATVLSQSATLVTYGPYKRDGQHTAESNAAFDASLRERNATWGVRDMGEVQKVAASSGFHLEEVIPMPANNFSLTFRRV